MSQYGNFGCPCKGSFTSVGGNGAVCILPPWQSQREAEGLNAFIAVDYCMVPETTWLWEQGVRTGGVCCGHGQIPATVAVLPESFEKMYELGYKLLEENHIFAAKTEVVANAAPE